MTYLLAGILVCKKEQIVHDGFAYTFNKTKVNDEAISLQLCNSTGKIRGRLFYLFLDIHIIVFLKNFKNFLIYFV